MNSSSSVWSHKPKFWHFQPRFVWGFFVCFVFVGGGHVRKSKIHWFHLFADYDLENGAKKAISINEKNVKNVSHHLPFEEVVDLTYSHLQTVKSWKWESVLVTTPNYSIKTLYIHSEHWTDHSAQMCLDAFTNMLDVMQSLAYCAGWFLRRFQDFVTILFPLDLLFFFYLKCTCEKLENVGSWVFFYYYFIHCVLKFIIFVILHVRTAHSFI